MLPHIILYILTNVSLGFHGAYGVAVSTRACGALSSGSTPDRHPMHGLDNQNQVFFYEQEFYPFSNFSSFKLEWKGELWMTSEHAYHAEKFGSHPEILDLLRESRSAHDAMTLAYANKDKYRKDWDEIKLSVMKQILHAKVAQHPYVKKKLLESGDRELIENSWRDSYWGWGPNKDGQNHLGKLWMEVRAEVKAQK